MKFKKINLFYFTLISVMIFISSGIYHHEFISIQKNNSLVLALSAFIMLFITILQITHIKTIFLAKTQQIISFNSIKPRGKEFIVLVLIKLLFNLVLYNIFIWIIFKTAIGLLLTPFLVVGYIACFKYYIEKVILRQNIVFNTQQYIFLVITIFIFYLCQFVVTSVQFVNAIITPTLYYILNYLIVITSCYFLQSLAIKSYVKNVGDYCE